MNTAYKHLDAKLKIAELTVGQWLGLFAGVMAAIVYGMYLTPFGETVTLFTAVYVGGVPVAAVFMASMSEFNFWLLVRSAIRWRRADGRYLPGAGEDTPGYCLTVAHEEERRAARDRIADLDVTTLWGEP